MADSALELVRALKSPSDPPRPGGPSKIQLARQGWSNASLYMPNKAETILEWLLTRLLKEKGKDSDANPMLNPQYWNLLHEILIVIVPSSSNPSNNPTRLWLLPLLNRVPLPPITTTLLNLSATTSVVSDEQLSLALGSFSALWPYASPKLSLDLLLDCCGALFAYLSALSCKPLLEHSAYSVSLSKFALSAFSSYKESLGNAAHKKKICSTFIQQHLRHWLTCISFQSGELQNSDVLNAAYDVGVETIFNVDVLRAAREQQAQASVDEALTNLIGPIPDVVSTCLPRLFKSYIEVNKKYRNALFGQGSKNTGTTAADQARGASMKFFAMCEGLLCSITESTEIVWSTRRALLSIVDQEDLLVVGDEESAGILQQTGELAVTSLTAAYQAKRHDISCMILDTLSILTHIDYDLVPRALSRVLPIITKIPNATEPAIPYLSKLINFHTKTRTMDSLVESCLLSFISQPNITTTQHPRSAYGTASSSAILSQAFLDRLSKAVHGFLTPGQVPELTQTVIRSLQSRIEDFEESISRANPNDDGSRKKRKREKQTSSDGNVDPDYAAVVFAFMAKLSAVVLTALPLHIILDEVRQSVRNEIHEFYTGSIHKIVKKALKYCLDDNTNTWAWQIVTCAALRLKYCLVQAQLVTADDEKLLAKLAKLLKTDALLPELRIEIYRALLYESSAGKFSATAVVEEIIGEIEKQGVTNQAAWNGELHRLKDSSGISIAGLHLLLDRWLPTLNTLATPDQLKRIAESMLAILPARWARSEALEPANMLSLSSIFVKTLRNAEFWEMHNIRSAFLSLISQETSAMEGIELKSILTQPPFNRQTKISAAVTSIHTVYDILLYAPAEFLPRSVRTDLLKRALVADVVIGTSVKEEKLTLEQQQRLVVLREFMRRVFSHIGTIEHNAIQDYVAYLMNPPFLTVDGTSALEHVTLELIIMHLKTLLAQAEKGEDAGLVAIMNSFLTSLGTNAPSEQPPLTVGLQERTLVILIDAIVSQYKLSSFKGEVIESLENLFEHMFSRFHARLSSWTSANAHDKGILSAERSLNIWCRLLSLRRWLAINEPVIPLFGPKLVQGYLAVGSAPARDPATLPSAILALALEELHVAEHYSEQLQFIVAIYLVFYARCTNSGRKQLDDCLMASCRNLSIQGFSDILDFIIDGLQKQGLEKTAFGCLVHLSGIMIHSAPEGTLKITQEHVSRSLSMFVNIPQYTQETELAEYVVSFVARYFNDRPAALKSSQVSLTWSLLGSCLAGASSHDDRTSKRMFHEIISILSALIRLRRDLVLSTLPHLCIMLSRLVICLKSVFPNLGAHQTKLVSNSLPRWINTKESFDFEESRALARLFTTLTTKTIVRTHSAAVTETQKADSLARPLSKHVSVVLKTYVDTLTDPLCILPSEMRRELESGLFALCEIIGEQYRDALMVTLDTAGKAVMKGLWREYEKQRYVGKG